MKILPLITPIVFLINFTILSGQEVLKLERVEGFDSNERIDDIKIGDDDEIWVASSSGIKSMNGAAPRTRIDMQNAVAVKTSKKGVIYSGFEDNSIYADEDLIFRIQAGIKISGDEDNIKITDLELYNSKLWVASTDGIFIFNTKNKKLLQHYHTHNSKLKSGKINFIHADKDDNLWIGTDAGYVKIKDGDNWKIQDTKLKYSAIAEIESGLFLVSDSDLNFIKRNGQWNSMGLNKGLSVGQVNDITLDADGFLYVASDILVKYDPYLDKIEEYTDALGIVSEKCLSLASDKDNNIWLGTSDAGLFRIFKGDMDLAELEAIALIDQSIACVGESTASIFVEVSGGEGPYNYKWNKMAVNGANPTGLSAGDYSVTITDKYDHTISTNIRVPEPREITIEIEESGRVTGPGKKDGSCNIKVKGGTSPYTIKWDNGETGKHAKKLSQGFHNVDVFDKNGCVGKFSVEIQNEKFIPELDIETIAVGQTLKINKLFFDADSSAITEVSFDVLDEVFDFLSENDNIVIEIGGHTNSKPPHEYCDALSSSRAENVAEYLYNKGISAKRISHKGYGKRNPKYSNRTKDGQRKNQRVEIKILEIK